MMSVTIFIYVDGSANRRGAAKGVYTSQEQCGIPDSPLYIATYHNTCIYVMCDHKSNPILVCVIYTLLRSSM